MAAHSYSVDEVLELLSAHDDVTDTLGAVLEYQDDVEHVAGERARALLAEVRGEVAAS